MAITATTVFQGQNLFIADVVSSADGDTTADVVHGLGPAVPGQVIITPQVGAAAAFAALPQWAVTVVDATKVTLTKVGTTGTAVNSNMRLIVTRPHSILR